MLIYVLRTVRDRLLQLEKAVLDLHLRQLDDVQPLDWQRANYEMKSNLVELDRIIEGE